MNPAKYNFTGESGSIPIFPILIGLYKDLNYLDIKDDFMNLCKNERDHDPQGRIISNRGGWQSKTDWIYYDEYKLINQYIHCMIEKIFYESFDHSGELEFNLGGCWININQKNSYNTLHSHPGCDYAGVLYIDHPDEDGFFSIALDNPSSYHVCTTSGMYSDNLKQSCGLYTEIDLSVQEGTMIIFPSHLYHQVEPHGSEGERISIAFNIKISDYGRFSDKMQRGRYSW